MRPSPSVEAVSPVTAEQFAGWVERGHTVEGQAGRWVEAWREIIGTRSSAPAAPKGAGGTWAAFQAEQAARRAAAKRARKARRVGAAAG